MAFRTLDPSDVQQVPVPDDYTVALRPDGVLVIPGPVAIRHFRKRSVVVQYEAESNILGIIPCEAGRRSATRTTGKHHPQGQTRVAIGRHLQLIGFQGSGRYPSEWVPKPGRLDVFLSRSIEDEEEADVA